MRRINLTEYAVTTKTDKGKDGDTSEVESQATTMVKLGLTYVLTFSLYLFTLLYGSMIMRSVLEEKTTRIVEVIISSVKPHQLLFGKIIGVCLVCLTMFLIWGGSAVLLLMNLHPILDYLRYRDYHRSSWKSPTLSNQRDRQRFCIF